MTDFTLAELERISKEEQEKQTVVSFPVDTTTETITEDTSIIKHLTVQKTSVVSIGVFALGTLAACFAPVSDATSMMAVFGSVALSLPFVAAGAIRENSIDKKNNRLAQEKQAHEKQALTTWLNAYYGIQISSEDAEYCVKNFFMFPHWKNQTNMQLMTFTGTKNNKTGLYWFVKDNKGELYVSDEPVHFHTETITKTLTGPKVGTTFPIEDIERLGDTLSKECIEVLERIARLAKGDVSTETEHAVERMRATLHRAIQADKRITELGETHSDLVGEVLDGISAELDVLTRQEVERIRNEVNVYRAAHATAGAASSSITLTTHASKS
jgi:hypothetical protein